MRAIELPAYEGHAAPVTHVAFSPHGPELASCSYDGTALVWALAADGRLAVRHRLRHRRLVNAAAWAPHVPGVLATASADKTVAIWRLDGDGPDGARLVTLLARHTDDVNAVAWLPEGDRLVTVSEDSTALLWEAESGRFLGRVASHAGHCMAVSVSPTGLVLTVGEDGGVSVGPADGSVARRTRTFPSSIEGCQWSRDGTRAALACDDGAVRIVSPELDLLAEVPCSSAAVRSVAWASDGSDRLVVGSYDATVRVVDGGGPRHALLATASGGRLWPRSLDTKGPFVAVGSFGRSPVLLDLDGLARRHDGGPATYGPNALAVVPGRLLVGLDSGDVLSLPQASLAAGRSGGARRTALGESPVLSLASAPGGALAGTYGGRVLRFDPEGDPRPLAALDLRSPVPSLARRPGADVAYAGTYGGDLATLDLAGAGLRVTATRAMHEGSIKSVLCVGAEQTISAATDGVVRLAGPAGPGAVLWRHGNLVNAVAYDPVGPRGQRGARPPRPARPPRRRPPRAPLGVPRLRRVGQGRRGRGAGPARVRARGLVRLRDPRVDDRARRRPGRRPARRHRRARALPGRLVRVPARRRVVRARGLGRAARRDRRRRPRVRVRPDGPLRRRAPGRGDRRPGSTSPRSERPVLELDLVPVPGGTLRVGASVERVRADVLAHADLGIPWHYFSKETGDASFEIPDLRVQRCPMTWGELREVLPEVETAARTAEEGPRHPVDRLSWETAERVAAHAARLLGRPLRLLTEWEWEHVARGGDDRVYPWGDVYEASRCNLAEAGCGGTRPVGSFPSGASRHGVLDLAGNVDEWTSSLYAPLPGCHWSVPRASSGRPTRT